MEGTQHTGTRPTRRRSHWIFRVGLAVFALALLGLAPSQPARAGLASHYGMTWSTVEQRGNGLVHVGHWGTSDPYNGDTPPSTSLPILCLKVDNLPVPSTITPDFHNGWSGGYVALSTTVQGYALTSQAEADRRCASQFGAGWRMAEFHDGRYGPSLQYSGGWSFWAYGWIASGARFWVAINDQAANPWNE
ncbi:MAG TPA: hypothetical protein VFS21_20385 [Roseiflexaceae bacterium]|nr:hypothetical protein [Roseiflexaceae bacterium]